MWRVSSGLQHPQVFGIFSIFKSAVISQIGGRKKIILNDLKSPFKHLIYVKSGYMTAVKVLNQIIRFY